MGEEKERRRASEGDRFLLGAATPLAGATGSITRDEYTIKGKVA
jgi:hypothetical protein